MFVFLERKFLDDLKSRREVNPTESLLLWCMNVASLGKKGRKIKEKTSICGVSLLLGLFLLVY